MAPTDIVWSDSPPGPSDRRNVFFGLSLSSTPHTTLLDGNLGSHWWFSVGNSQAIHSGNPVAPFVDRSGIAQRTSLYIQQGKQL